MSFRGIAPMVATIHSTARYLNDRHRALQHGFWGAMVAVVVAGCATVQPFHEPALEQQVRQTFRETFPRPVKLRQRAIVTVAGRSFSCDGLLQVAADGSARLAMLAPVGVMAEVRVRPDEVVRTAPNFPRNWAQEHVVAVVRLLCPGNMAGWKFGRLANGQLVLTDGRTTYVFSADGRQWLAAECGGVRAVPGRVTGPGYELELRTVSP